MATISTTPNLFSVTLLLPLLSDYSIPLLFFLSFLIHFSCITLPTAISTPHLQCITPPSINTLSYFPPSFTVHYHTPLSSPVSPYYPLFPSLVTASHTKLPFLFSISSLHPSQYPIVSVRLSPSISPSTVIECLIHATRPPGS